MNIVSTVLLATGILFALAAVVLYTRGEAILAAVFMAVAVADGIVSLVLRRRSEA